MDRSNFEIPSIKDFVNRFVDDSNENPSDNMQPVKEGQFIIKHMMAYILRL
jgi:hypothetical protein